MKLLLMEVFRNIWIKTYATKFKQVYFSAKLKNIYLQIYRKQVQNYNKFKY